MLYYYLPHRKHPHLITSRMFYIQLWRQFTPDVIKQIVFGNTRIIPGVKREIKLERGTLYVIRNS